MDYQKILENIYQAIQPYAKEGKQADYIPELAKVNPDQFGMCLHTIYGEIYSIEQADKLRERLCKEPSGTAFNSLIQLEVEKGIPRNPFINAGAIVMSDILLSHLERPEEQFLDFVRTLAGDNTIDYNRDVATSERETGYLNAAIANLLKYHGTIENDIEQVLRFYFLMCSVEMSCRELSRAFLAFANHRRKFNYAGVTLTASKVKRMNAIM